MKSKIVLIVLPPPSIKDSTQTLQILIDSKKSFIRFGDGEYIIMEGGNIPFQKYNENLTKTLQDAITSQDEDLLIGLNRSYFYAPSEEELTNIWRYSWIASNFHIIKKYLIPNKEYGNAGIAWCGDMFKKLFSNKKLLIICGEKVLNVEHNIFKDTPDIREIAYIYGPDKHAYSKIDAIKREILTFDRDWTLVFALGPAGKAIAYEMFKEGYRVLDIGHVIKAYNVLKSGVKLNTAESIYEFYRYKK